MPARYETLARWTTEYGWTRGAELGVSDGRTHLYLLEHCPNLHLIGVDAWDIPGIKPGPTFSNEVCRCPTCIATKAGRKKTTVQEREQMARAGVARFGRSKLYKMTTVEGAKKARDKTLDFIFIDADHSREGLREDIAAWRHKVKPGGWVIGHDYNMSSVRAGVWDHFRPSEVEEEDDHLWYVRL